MIKNRPTVYEFYSEGNSLRLELHIDYDNRNYTITNNKGDKNFVFTDKTDKNSMNEIFDLIKEAKEFGDLVVSEMD